MFLVLETTLQSFLTRFSSSILGFIFSRTAKGKRGCGGYDPHGKFLKFLGLETTFRAFWPAFPAVFQVSFQLYQFPNHSCYFFFVFWNAVAGRIRQARGPRVAHAWSTVSYQKMLGSIKILSITECVYCKKEKEKRLLIFALNLWMKQMMRQFLMRGEKNIVLLEKVVEELI